MGAIEDYFYKKYADKRRFKTDELYLGLLARSKEEPYQNNRLITKYNVSRFVILQPATDDEILEYWKNKFGSKPSIFFPSETIVDYEKLPGHLIDSFSSYYRAPTMTNIILPLTNPEKDYPHMRDSKETFYPFLEKLYGKVVPLKNAFGSNMQLANKLSLNELVELESYINSYVDVHEIAKSMLD